MSSLPFSALFAFNAISELCEVRVDCPEGAAYNLMFALDVYGWEGKGKKQGGLFRLRNVTIVG
jgi:hypothetical protein